ncbi:AAA family ATPase [Roseomonas sp. CAU 1739]|uniref:AAA family ATPase n=1 Tax=Roseomonas sp. CAU 1739 TaxID=3140364 RepID=UPI00325AE93C
MDAGSIAEGIMTRAPAEHLRGRLFGRLRVLSVADASEAPARLYLLHGLIAPAELSVWWGAPKCGKSFLMLRVAYGLARERGMWDRKARPCRVLYVAAEGEGGFARRLVAVRDELGDAGDAFHYIAQRATVGPPSDDLEAIIDAATALRANLVVLDTLARTFGDGNEDKAQDMGGFIAAADEIRERSKAHVAIIHHGSKDPGAMTPRGSGSLLGGADLVVKIAKGAAGAPSTATVTDNKDDEEGVVLPFTLRVVDMGTDSDGNPRTTCLADEAEASSGRTARPKLNTNHAAWLSDINDMMLEGAAVERSPLPGMKPNLTLTREQVRDGLRVRGRFEAESHAPLTAKDRARLRDTLNALKDKKVIGLSDQLVWLP